MDAQTSERRDARNVLFVEGGGAATVYSVNYERFLTTDVSLRVGYGFVEYDPAEFSWFHGCGIFLLSCPTQNVSRHALPVTLSWTGGRTGPHLFNLSAGATTLFFRTTTDEGEFVETRWSAAPTAEVGYRFQPRSGGFFFRVGVTMTLLEIGRGEWRPLPWPSLALGGTF